MHHISLCFSWLHKKYAREKSNLLLKFDLEPVLFHPLEQAFNNTVKVPPSAWVPQEKRVPDETRRIALL